MHHLSRKNCRRTSHFRCAEPYCASQVNKKLASGDYEDPNDPLSPSPEPEYDSMVSDRVWVLGGFVPTHVEVRCCVAVH